jgi:diguanylate cyclase (GGDEF)-like protein/PAS domain S-box-containing protein
MQNTPDTLKALEAENARLRQRIAELEHAEPRSCATMPAICAYCSLHHPHHIAECSGNPHQKIQMDLLAEHQQLYMLAMHAPYAACVLRGARHVIAFANPACAGLLGTSTLTDQPLTALWPDPHSQSIFDLLAAAYHSGRPQTAYSIYVYRDGWPTPEQREVWLDVTCQPIHTINAQDTALILYMTDVTERVRTGPAHGASRQLGGSTISGFSPINDHAYGMVCNITNARRTEHTLHQSQTLLQSILDYAPAIIYVKDMQWRCLLTNEQCASILNRKPGQMIGIAEEELYSPAHIQQWRPFDEQVLATGKPVEAEGTYELADGLHTFFSVRFPLFDEQGRIYAIGVIATDITAHRQTEATLRENEASNEHLLRSNAGLYEEARRRAEEAETLCQVGAAVASSLDQEETIRLILEHLARVVPHDRATVQLLQGEESVIVGARGLRNPHMVLGRRFPLHEHIPTRIVYEHQQPYLTLDEDHLGMLVLEPNLPRRSWLGVPLAVGDRMIGMITLDSDQADQFTPDHARILMAFADQVAVALDHARLFSEVQELATTDPLTGLWNRRHFFDLTERECLRARRYRHPFSVVMLDIDHFKQVNDTYGHAVGDQVLKQAAAQCRRVLRKVDIVARYGGEEMIMMLPETSLEGAHMLAERVRNDLETPIETECGPLAITASLGVACHYPGDRITLEQLIDRADQCLYAAKQGGRNRVIAWSAAPLKEEEA